MSRRISTLGVFVHAQTTGLLACGLEPGPSQWSYTYLPKARADIALSMPRSESLYVNSAILPPFEQHLPEMELGLFPAAIWKLIRHDEMGLLLVTGNRRLGRLSFAEPGNDIPGPAGIRLTTAQLASIENGEEFLLDTLSRLSFIPGVSGIQPKTLAHISVGELSPARAPVDTHILKGNRSEYPWATVNEYACLHAAEACKLQVPKRTLSKDGRLLAIERFDLEADGSHAIGFDEACSLMGLHAKDKYSGSYEAMWRGIKPFLGAATRIESARTLFRLLAFNYAIENGDAHLKNFGLIYRTGDDARLAPAYDLLTTTAYEALARDAPALTLDGKKIWDAYCALIHFGKRGLMLSDVEMKAALSEIADGITTSIDLLPGLSEQYPGASIVLEQVGRAWQCGITRLRAFLES